MYGLYEVAADLAQITLPSTPDVGLPYGFPYNVFVALGPAPAIIGTGQSGARDALRAALHELGVDPARITRVLLTSTLPESVGNVPLFPNAAVYARCAPSFDRERYNADLRTEIEELARGLVHGEMRHTEWNDRELDTFLDAYLPAGAPPVDIVPVRAGTRLRFGGLMLETLDTPGVCPHATVYFEPGGGRLFCGESVVIATEPRVRDPQAFTDSLTRVSQLRPSMLLPAYGGVERSYQVAFRRTNLSVSNLISSMPFALHGPTPAPVIAINDLGYVPRDLVRFAATVQRFKVMLDELVKSGVAVREGEGAWARYSMDRPSRM